MQTAPIATGQSDSQHYYQRGADSDRAFGAAGVRKVFGCRARRDCLSETKG